MAVSPKVKYMLLMVPRHFTTSYLPKRNENMPAETCKQMFIVPLFTRLKTECYLYVYQLVKR